MPGDSRFSFPGPALLCLSLSHCLFINRRRDGGPPPWVHTGPGPGRAPGTGRTGSHLVQGCPIPQDSADSDSRMRLARRPGLCRSLADGPREGPVHVHLDLVPPALLSGCWHSCSSRARVRGEEVGGGRRAGKGMPDSPGDSRLAVALALAGLRGSRAFRCSPPYYCPSSWTLRPWVLAPHPGSLF